VPLCPPQTPHAARARTRTTAVGSQRLTTWATVRPYGLFIPRWTWLRMKEWQAPANTLWNFGVVYGMRWILQAAERLSASQEVTSFKSRSGHTGFMVDKVEILLVFLYYLPVVTPSTAPQSISQPTV
jgi:hypothetical protein